MKKIIIDRIENDLAVCESDIGMMVLPLSVLPDGVHEGSILEKSDGVWTACPDEENERKEELFDLAESLFDE